MEIASLRITVPTYHGNRPSYDHKDPSQQEFGVPSVPVLIHSADSVRLVLGSHGLFDLNKPDIAIERRPNGWAIFMHPIGGGDPCGYVLFMDDGRSFLARDPFPDGSIVVLDPHDDIPEELDRFV